MKINTKIPKIKGSYYFVLVNALIVGGFLIVRTPSNISEKPDVPQPKVLGAQIDLRGPKEENTLKPYFQGLSEEQAKRISAKSYLVYESSTGEIFAEKNRTEKLPIASLTKLMTGYLAYKYLDFGTPITINLNRITRTSPVVNFINGDNVKVGDIFNAMIVGSANDAAQILAREVSSKTKEDVIDLMNKEAASLNMASTNFSNPNGFDSEDNYSTAEDLTKLVQKTQELSAFANLGLTKQLSFSGSKNKIYSINNTNKLILKEPGLEAIKTGSTPKALGSMITKVNKPGNTYIILVIGSQNREDDTLILKNEIVDKIVWQ